MEQEISPPQCKEITLHGLFKDENSSSLINKEMSHTSYWVSEQ